MGFPSTYYRRVTSNRSRGYAGADGGGGVSHLINPNYAENSTRSVADFAGMPKKLKKKTWGPGEIGFCILVLLFLIFAFFILV
jgi:hypothetical protein